MGNVFKNILIPVDLSANTEIAFTKALEFAEFGTTIHLFHVLRDSRPGIGGIVRKYFDDMAERPAFIQAKTKLNQWRASMNKYKPHVNVSTWIVEEGSIQKAIKNKATELKADLIVLVRQSQRLLFPMFNRVNPAVLSQNTGLLVLSLKAGAFDKSKAMVIPVTNESSLQAQELISIVCRKFVSKIYLVTFSSGSTNPVDSNASSLLQVYRWLKTIHIEVEYAALSGFNKARVVLNYADKVNADTLLYYPRVDKKMDTHYIWRNKPGYVHGAG
ncbi:MAG: universal stress protein [Ferruginibacter sp.]